jgi:hypothetical protein
VDGCLLRGESRSGFGLYGFDERRAAVGRRDCSVGEEGGRGSAVPIGGGGGAGRGTCGREGGKIWRLERIDEKCPRI